MALTDSDLADALVTLLRANRIAAAEGGEELLKALGDVAETDPDAFGEFVLREDGLLAQAELELEKLKSPAAQAARLRKELAELGPPRRGEGSRAKLRRRMAKLELADLEPEASERGSGDVVYLPSREAR